MARSLVARMNEADCVIAVARHFAERLRELGLERITIIQNGVDTRRFAPTPPDPALMRSLRIADDRIVVAHFSNLKDFKRPLDLVHSAALAVERDPRLLYLVVGDGSLRESLEAECRRLGLAECFRFVGWVPFEEVPRYLHLAHMSALPSETEALALAYLETQACARVLIASDVPAAHEVVEDGASGLLFPVGDVRAFAEQTLRAAADPDLRATIGGRARAAALAHSIETELDGFEAVLASVAAARQHRA
jgi:L-malate glycosyltransferase